jgi:hypothetical protein
MVEKIGGNLLGVVLNNINLAQDENYYYYSGYYYDYYSRSYDEYEPSKGGEYAARGEYASHGEYTSKEAKEDKKIDLKPKY